MKKIMFNDRYGLTQSVLERRKTHTRRIINERLFQECRSNGFIEAGGYNSQWKEKSIDLLLAHSTYKIGEEVAVAQSYNTIIQEIFDKGGELKDSCSIIMSKGLNNKMFVHSHRMPHRIRITNVRVERLHDISPEDCLKEGIVCKNERYVIETYKGVEFYTKDVKLAFKYLIDKICGKGTWDSNPWVFVYDFELIK